MVSIGNNPQIHSVILNSSTEIPEVMGCVKKIEKEIYLIHILSYMHNTVLVQNLKTELSKLFPNAKIVFLKHENKAQVSLQLYSVDKMDEYEKENLSDEILNKLQQEYILKNTTLKECNKNLINRFFTDNLTHLPNIYQLRKDLSENENAGLIVLNIDNFKIINNFYGFIVGDFVVEQVGKYILENISKDIVYRISADEFAIVIEQNLDFYDLKEYLQSIYEQVENLTIDYQDIKIFVGLTLASCANTTTHNIFSKVSMALKYAQEMRLPFWIYEDRMHFENEYEKNLKFSSVVRHAVENSKIVPYFQAMIDNKSSKIVKFECLARLIDENDKIISPNLFIPISKKIKVYNIVTKTIIDKSFAAFADNEYEFSINLSIEDILSSEIYEFILEKLKTCDSAHRVTFELLESEAIQDFNKVERFITEVKRYGAKIAIDDFGSGYSNFSYLTKMKVDFIKIDSSLIENIDTDKNSLMVVETIVDFAKKLGVKTVAEFVHSSTINDKVIELGIDYSQGFYIDKPSIDVETTTR